MSPLWKIFLLDAKPELVIINFEKPCLVLSDLKEWDKKVFEWEGQPDRREMGGFQNTTLLSLSFSFLFLLPNEISSKLATHFAVSS